MPYRLMLVASVVALYACSDDTSPPKDAGMDSKPPLDLIVDAPKDGPKPDLVVDRGADSQKDAGTDAHRDSSQDSRLDGPTPDMTDGPIGNQMKVYFKKPQSWQTAYIHYWNTSPSNDKTSWPGVSMTDEGGGWYSYSLANEKSAGIVFNDNGSEQTVDLYRVGGGYFAPSGQSSGKLANGNATKVKTLGRWHDKNPDVVPFVSAYPAGGNFYGDKVSVELSTEGTSITTRRYTLDGSDPAVGGTTFTDGKVVDIGAAAATGATLTLRVYAATSGGNISKTFTFKKNAATNVEAWKPANKPAKKTESGRWVYLTDFNNDQGLEARNVTIYLPADYASKPHRRYRVVYFHDGQNLFSPATATFGQEWMVDEHYDELRSEKLIHPVIFVGIWSAKDGGTRTMEYVGGCGNGDAKAKYAAWLIHSLKPYIDHHYRTRPEAEFTYTMGSSFGGIISYYLSWTHPTVFNNAACVSTAFHCGGAQILQDILSYSGAKKPIHYWTDGGFKEGTDLPTGRTSYVENNRQFAEKLAKLGWRENADLGFMEAVGEGHNETAWSRRIKQVLYFMLKKKNQLRIAHVEVRTAKDTLSVGSETYVSLDIRYEDGPLITKVFSDTTKKVTFTATPASAVTIDAEGKLTANAAGTVTIDASYEGFSASTTLEIQ
jgi:predicted alpha/beta superfamily hydrolase